MMATKIMKDGEWIGQWWELNENRKTALVVARYLGIRPIKA